MKKLIFILFTSLAIAQTPNIVPKANGEGQLGTSAKHWRSLHADSLFFSYPSFLLSSDTTAFRTFSDLKYLKNADSTSIRTFSDLKYLKNADSATFRTASNGYYAPKIGSTNITTLGTIGTGTWQATSIDTAYTNAVSKIVSGNTFLTATKISKDYRLTPDTSRQGFWTTKGYLAKKDIDSVGTISRGVWQGTSIDTAYTNAVSKLTAGYGITATKNAKDYTVVVDSATLRSKYVPYSGANAAVNLGAQTLTTTGTVTTGQVAINNSSGITTNQTTFPLVNTTATTINFGGAATTLNMGAVTGINTISGVVKVNNILRLPNNGGDTLVTNAFNITNRRSSNINLDTEAAAALDTLDTINGGTEGDILIIGTTSSTRDILVRTATGNIICGANFTLDNTRDKAMLIFYSSVNSWLLLSFSNNQ